MFKELAKIANKLDGLGLTKEADILDAYLAKVAMDPGQDPSLHSQQEINDYNLGKGQANIGAKNIMAIYNKVLASATGWEKYIAETANKGYGDGNKVKQAWAMYVANHTEKNGVADGVTPGGQDGISPSFSSFVRWYNDRKNGDPSWGGKEKGIGGVIEALKAETDQYIADSSPLYNHSEAVASTPQYKGDSRGQKTPEEAQALSGPAIPPGGSNLGAGDLFQKDQYGNRIVPPSLNPNKPASQR